MPLQNPRLVDRNLRYRSDGSPYYLILTEDSKTGQIVEIHLNADVWPNGPPANAPMLQ